MPIPSTNTNPKPNSRRIVDTGGGDGIAISHIIDFICQRAGVQKLSDGEPKSAASETETAATASWRAGELLPSSNHACMVAPDARQLVRKRKKLRSRVFPAPAYCNFAEQGSSRGCIWKHWNPRHLSEWPLIESNSAAAAAAAAFSLLCSGHAPGMLRLPASPI